MIGVGFLRCFFIVGVMSWYTTSVWKTIDGYFRDQFREYLQKEFEANVEMRKDLISEAERLEIQKALLAKIGKMGFSVDMLDSRGRVDSLRSVDQHGQLTPAETSNNLLKDDQNSKIRDIGGADLTPGDHGNSEGADIQSESVEKVTDNLADSPKDEWTEVSESDGIYEFEAKEQHGDGNFKTRYGISEDECSLEECVEAAENQEPQNWQNSLLEDEVCYLEDLGKKDSCGDP